MVTLPTETVFTWGAPPIKFGAGATDELAFDLAQLGVERVLIITDPGVSDTGIPERVRRMLADQGLKPEVYDQASVEPTDDSLRAAAKAVRGTDWDGFVAIGGGSSIDTAKAVNLLTAHPGDDVMDYVNKPVGGGKGPSQPLKPLVAVPTTAGTGSESTPVCVLDILGLKVKSGISHPKLRPALAVVDPLNTLSLPPQVTAASGMDVVCHALESYTARRYQTYPHKQPAERVAYNGANPISDVWSEQALRLIAGSFRKAVLNGHDLAARTAMLQAASFAGMGFGNAGVHIPHACAYPIAGMVKDYVPEGYTTTHALVPHGQSVCVTAPAAFRFTFPADPERHVHAATLLGGHKAYSSCAPERLVELLPGTLISLMRDIGIPNGIGALGYSEADIPELVRGALKQQRLLVVAPRPVGEVELAAILRESLENW